MPPNMVARLRLDSVWSVAEPDLDRSHSSLRWSGGAVAGVCVAFAVTLIGAGIAHAQRAVLDLPEISRQPWVHRHWTVSDGLPVNVLTGVAQDDTGYLWIGTGDGLVRFDGNRFVTLRPAQEPALESPRIKEVIRHRDTVWFLTAAGLTRLRGGVLQAVQPTSPEDGSFVELRRRGGRLWALAQHALYEVGADGELKRAEELPQDHHLLDLLIARTGRVWLLTSRGIGWREDNALRWYLTAVATDGAIETDRGLVFFRRDSPPLLHRDGIWTEEPEALIPGLRLHGTGTVAESPWGTSHLVLGTLTLRTDGSQHEVLDATASSFIIKPGFALEDPQTGRWTAVGPEVRLNGQALLRVAEGSDAGALEMDREGTVWVASSRDGLHALSPASVRMIDDSVGVNPPNIYGIYADRAESLWLATLGGGAWRRTGGGWSRVPMAGAPEGPAFARTFLEDGQGTIWVGLVGGIRRWTDGRLVTVDEPGVPRVRINAFEIDDLGRMWVGTAAGLYRREVTAQGPVWRAVTVDGSSLGEVRSLLWTPAGKLWIVGEQGLARFDGARWLRIHRDNGLPTNLTRSLTFDNAGTLWVGTEDAGLVRVDPLTDDTPLIATFGPQQGLDTTSVHHVFDDEAGFLWLSSNSGIFRVERSDLDDVAAGTNTQVRAVRFDELDGMNNREANGGTDNAGLRSADGRLWFATQDGVAVIDPAALLPIPLQASTTVIEGVRVGQEQRILVNDFTLAADERTFSVQYTTPAPSGARRARFRYRLIGFDDRWSEAGPRREAFFTEVPEGHYRFEVETLGIPGLLEGSRTSASIVVLPRFWETYWFKAITVLGFLVLLVLIVRWRDHAHRQRQRELEALVSERTAVVSEQAERLRRLDRVKSDLFTDVSHEFRTPLTLAIGPLQDLLDGVRGDLAEPARAEVDLALRNTRRLLDLVNQILDVARMEAGQVRLAREQHSLDAFLRRRADKFSSLAAHEGIDLEFHSVPEMSQRDKTGVEQASDEWIAYFDANRLGRAIDNLLLNGLQWTPKGGSVRLRLARGSTPLQMEALEVAEEPPGDSFEIAVEDSGPGIAAADLDKIFLRFQRGGEESERGTGNTEGAPPNAQGHDEKTSVKRRGGGTGIGLAQTREIVRLHGGTVVVESTEGSGTTFRILLPAGAARETEVSSDTTKLSGLPEKSGDNHEYYPEDPSALNVDAGEPSRGPAQARSTSAQEPTTTEAERPLVLVVDDEPDVCDYVRRTLEPDYRVKVASNGSEALALARAEVPDAVVSDVMMPEMDGFTLIAEFNRDPELDFVPIVLLTARGADDTRLEALGLGADHYLVKPFLRDELRGCIHNLLARRKQWSAQPSTPSDPADGPQPLVHLPEIEPEPADQAFLRRLVAVADEGLGDPELDVEELASRLHCDRTYLFRKLRDLTGETPSALLRRVRLERAEQLLQGRAGNVSEVAYAVGFRSVSHFSRCFRQHFGITPSQVGQ